MKLILPLSILIWATSCWANSVQLQLSAAVFQGPKTYRVNGNIITDFKTLFKLTSDEGEVILQGKILPFKAKNIQVELGLYRKTKKGQERIASPVILTRYGQASQMEVFDDENNKMIYRIQVKAEHLDQNL